MDYKNCIDCKKIISFEEFCRDNPLIAESTAREIWNNELFSIHCLDCFYNRPERPFKIRRGRHRTYYQKQPSFH